MEETLPSSEFLTKITKSWRHEQYIPYFWEGSPFWQGTLRVETLPPKYTNEKALPSLKGNGDKRPCNERVG